MFSRRRRAQRQQPAESFEMTVTPTDHKDENAIPPHRHTLPTHHGKKITKGIKAEGESGRRGIHPLKFIGICFRSSCTLSKFVNILWPFVPVAFALHWRRPKENLWNFVLPYIAMIPAANLLGFAGQEFARKLPKVAGVFLETTFGSIVEIILFIILIKEGVVAVPIIKAAILGSILANLLLCLGLCFFAGGLRRDEQEFHEAVSEVGSNLMLVAGMGLVVPAVFSTALSTANNSLADDVLKISRASAIILLVAFLAYMFFQMRSHHGLYDEVLKADEEKDADRHLDTYKPKLTMTEALVAVVLALTVVTFMAFFLVQRIPYMVKHRGIKDA